MRGLSHVKEKELVLATDKPGRAFPLTRGFTSQMTKGPHIEKGFEEERHQQA